MEPEPSQTFDPGMTPVADLLRRIAAELRDLAQTVDDLQQAVGALGSVGVARDARAMRQLQNFDSLIQTIAGVADFTEALGEAAPERWRLNPHPASRIVRLSDLAARLVSRQRAAPDASAAGELELF